MRRQRFYTSSLYHQEKRRFILNRIEIKEQGLFPCLRHAVFSQVIKHF